jgi:hypothetical protein
VIECTTAFVAGKPAMIPPVDYDPVTGGEVWCEILADRVETLLFGDDEVLREFSQAGNSVCERSIQCRLVLETGYGAELIAGASRPDAGLAVAVIDLLQAAHQRR